MDYIDFRQLFRERADMAAEQTIRDWEAKYPQAAHLWSMASARAFNDGRDFERARWEGCINTMYDKFGRSNRDFKSEHVNPAIYDQITNHYFASGGVADVSIVNGMYPDKISGEFVVTDAEYDAITERALTQRARIAAKAFVSPAMPVAEGGSYTGSGLAPVAPTALLGGRAGGPIPADDYGY